jgi:hypothetical protein
MLKEQPTGQPSMLRDVLHICTFSLPTWFDHDGCLTCRASHDQTSQGRCIILLPGGTKGEKSLRTSVNASSLAKRSISCSHYAVGRAGTEAHEGKILSFHESENVKSVP